VTRNTAELLESEDIETALKDLGTAKMLRCRIHYFTDDAVIGGKWCAVEPEKPEERYRLKR
jgi:hypothetical protein